MRQLLFILLTFLMFNCRNTNNVLSEREKPTSYLSIKEETWTKGANVIVGTLTNSSSMTDYSNIVLIVQYYSADGKKIGTERLVEFFILNHGKSKKYKRDINPPSLTERLQTTIDRAQFLDYDEMPNTKQR